MKSIIQLALWDWKIQGRYQIQTVAVVLTLLYWLLFYALPFENIDGLIIVCVYSDPAALGMVFVGALVLFEKNERTLQAMAVSPVPGSGYLWSKALSLTVLSLFLGLAMAIAGHGWQLHYFWLAIGIILTGLFFTFIGFLAVARVNSINQYILFLFPFLVVFNLPIFNFLKITDSWLLYLLPSQGSFLLLEAGFGRDISYWQLIYSVGYLLISIVVAYRLALRAYHRHIIQKL